MDGIVTFDIQISQQSIQNALRDINTQFARGGVSINNLSFTPQALANIKTQIDKALAGVKVTIPPPKFSGPIKAPDVPAAAPQKANQDILNNLRAQLATTQALNAETSEQSQKLNQQAASIREALRFKQQLASIRNAGLDPDDLRRAEQFAREITRINQQRIRIPADVDVEPVRRSSSVVTGIFQGIGQQITSIITNALGSAFRAGLGAIQGSLGDVASFEGALNQFQVRTRATTEQLAAFRAEAIKTGIETSKSPQDVADLGVSLASLGANAEEAAASVRTVVKASEATGIAVEDLAGALRVGQNVFGDQGETVETLADKFAILANTTAAAGASDFNQIFSKAGVAAKNAGADVEELLALFGTLRDTGSSAEIAGTAVAGIFTKFRGNTDEAKEALKQLEELAGAPIKLFDEFGNLRTDIPLIDTLKNLRDATASLSEEAAGDILGKIFGAGRGGGTAILQVLDQIDGKFQQTLENLRNSDGTAIAEASAGLLKGFSGALAFIQGTFNALSIELGSSFTGLLDPIISGAADIVGAFLATNPFEGIKKSADGLLQTLKDIPGINQTINDAFNTIATGAVQAIAGVIDDIAGALRNNPDVIQDITDRFVDSATAAFQLVDAVSDLIGPFVSLGNTVQGNLDILRQIPVVGNLIAGIIDPVGSLIIAFQTVQSVLGKIGVGFQIVKNIGISVFQEIAKTVGDLINNLGLRGPIDVLIGAFSTLRYGVLGTFQSIREGIDSALGRFKPLIDRILQALDRLNSFRDFQGFEGPGIAGTAAEGGNAITSAIKNIVNANKEANTEIAEDSVKKTIQSEEEKEKIRKEKLEKFQRDTESALNAIDQAQRKQIEGIRRQQLSGAITAEDADAQIAAIEGNTQARIKAKRDEIANINQLEKDKVLTAIEAAGQRESAELEISNLIIQGIEAEIAAQERLKEAALERLDNELNLAQQLTDIRQTELDIASDALSQQQSLLQAQQDLASSTAQLEESRLSRILETAKAEGDVTKAQQAAQGLAASKQRAIETEFTLKERSLAITIEQNRIEAQRAIIGAEIAATEARINLEKAKTEGATAEEVRNLESILNLRLEQVDSARDAAGNQESINGLLQQQLEVDRQLADEKLNQVSAVNELRKAEEDLAKKQQSLAEEQISQAKRIADARASAISSVFSAISQEASKSVEEGLASLDSAQQRLQTARNAGFFRGAEGSVGAQATQQAIQQVQQLLRSGASDQTLTNAAFRNRDNAAFAEALNLAGRGDIASLIDAEQGFAEVDQSIQQAREAITSKLEEVRQAIINRDIEAATQLPSSGLSAAAIPASEFGAASRAGAIQPGTKLGLAEQSGNVINLGALQVSTPDPVADTAQILSDFTRQQTRGRR